MLIYGLDLRLLTWLETLEAKVSRQRRRVGHFLLQGRKSSFFFMVSLVVLMSLVVLVFLVIREVPRVHPYHPAHLVLHEPHLRPVID